MTSGKQTDDVGLFDPIKFVSNFPELDVETLTTCQRNNIAALTETQRISLAAGHAVLLWQSDSRSRRK